MAGHTCISCAYMGNEQANLSLFSLSYCQSVIHLFITPLCHILAWDNFSDVDKTSVQLVDVVDFCIGIMYPSD